MNARFSVVLLLAILATLAYNMSRIGYVRSLEDEVESLRAENRILEEVLIGRGQ